MPKRAEGRDDSVPGGSSEFAHQEEQSMTDDELARLDLDVERLNFLNDCRTKLDLIRRGYVDDPDGIREAALEALIERHEHFSWLDPSVRVMNHRRVDRTY
jgi:hypothetical protein